MLAPELVLGDGTVAELVPGDLVAPVAERALGEFHDVSLVHQGHRFPVVVDGVLYRLAHQVLRIDDTDRLDADASVQRDLRVHLLGQEVDQLLRLRAPLLPFNAGVHVFHVLPVDDHIHFLGLLYRAWDAGQVPDRPDAGIELHLLAQGHVDASDPASDRRGEGALNGHLVAADLLQRVLGEPSPGFLEGFLSRQHLHPFDLPLAAVCLFNDSVQRDSGCAPYVGTGPVALHEKDHRIIGHRDYALFVSYCLCAHIVPFC